MTGLQTELYAYTIDPETLQEKLRRPERLAAWLDQALRTTEPGNPAEARMHHTQIGVAARLLRRLDVAEEHLRAALRLAERYGPTPSEVLARARFAQALQGQGRFGEALREFERCLEEGRLLPELGNHYIFVFHQAGRAYYESGKWDRARELLATALRLQLESEPDEEAVESARVALDASDACATAADVGRELYRLVPEVHDHAAERLNELFDRNGLQAHGDFLLPLRTLLLAGPVHTDLARAVHREYDGDVDAALAQLAAHDWLQLRGNHLVASERTREVLTALLDIIDDTARGLWGQPVELLESLDEVVCRGTGTSSGRVYDPWVAAAPNSGIAGRFFDRLCALQAHRADARATARLGEGVTIDQMRALPLGDPVRIRAAAATDRIAARLFRPLDVEVRVRLTDALHALPA
ncbi:hypothetical protein GCM10012275_40290 [Longimycelium tulufanense]|uniref:Tetratricopeptide repeat protein n=1 Tax=Longimycelium tulufanense TaxID=907463 RepID=A0A8J3CIB0_9PSEU|nr:tetratricopeptide repeat protein [Longimycelium tulufanense]GGM65666.1 hypothetical protein GCM10012275_40290 [Longimycelium tulufanense]